MPCSKIDLISESDSDNIYIFASYLTSPWKDPSVPSKGATSSLIGSTWPWIFRNNSNESWTAFGESAGSNAINALFSTWTLGILF